MSLNYIVGYLFERVQGLIVNVYFCSLRQVLVQKMGEGFFKGLGFLFVQGKKCEDLYLDFWV